jgi:2-oxoglutarate ferredoxin oxidoreductase subunit alpha
MRQCPLRGGGGDEHGADLQEVKKAVDEPEKVFLANRIDGELITPTDIRNILRLIQGKGV